MKSSRPYQQAVRAQKAAETEERIVEVAERLFSRESFDRVSLAAVAEAGLVSVPTLQRRFGDKEGLFAAVGDRVRQRILTQRQPPAGGDLDGALDALLAHYELEGRMVWHLLKQEQDVPPLREALAAGRALHRAWVEVVFDTALRPLEGGERARRADALVAATDVYVWKLLRLDLARSREEVASTMKAMARAVAEGAR
jgi:AcrR family transcriptional regulator